MPRSQPTPPTSDYPSFFVFLTKGCNQATIPVRRGDGVAKEASCNHFRGALGVGLCRVSREHVGTCGTEQRGRRSLGAKTPCGGNTSCRSYTPTLSEES